MCCVVLCCVVLCSGIGLGEMYLSRGLLRASQFFLRQDTTLHSNSTVAQQSRGTKNKFSIASIIMQILYLSRVRDGFWGNFTNLVPRGFGKSTIFLGENVFCVRGIRISLLTQCKSPILHCVRLLSYTR